MELKDVAIAAILKNGKMLRGLRKYTSGEYKDVTVWTIPGGRCEAGESLEETLKRETMEEVGIDDLKILERIGVLDGAKEGDIVHIFLCETKQEPSLMEPEKFLKWEWFDVLDQPTDYPDVNEKAFDMIREFFTSK